MLLLENHWDRWLDIYKKCGGGIGVRGAKIPKEIILTVQPKYTRGGLKNGKYKEIGVGKGWSVEGIFHFNKLIEFVRKDWSENPGFVGKWLNIRKTRIQTWFQVKKKEGSFISRRVCTMEFICKRE